MVAHDWGGLLDETSKPGRRDCCLLRLVANRTALRQLCILAPRKKWFCFALLRKRHFQTGGFGK